MESSKAHPHPISGLEKIVLAHLGIFLVATTWALGGNAGYVRVPLAIWGSLGALITIVAAAGDKRRTQVSLRPLRWLWPFGLFNALVLLAAHTPLFREITLGAGSYYTTVPMPPWRPAAAEPARALRMLWLFDAMYIASFNIALVLRHRRAIRGRLVIAACNALALSIFGTIQKLTGATGIFFGRVKVPNMSAFASFIYHNHWGAFIVLMSAVFLGLVRYHARRGEKRDFFHTPAFGGIVAVLFFAVTLPLSGSRSCTLLLAVLLAGALLGWVARLIRNRRSYGESVSAPLLGAAVAIVLGIAGIWFLAGGVIAQRVAKTEEQIAGMRQEGGAGSRATLYADTLRMAEDRIWFGWGMASFPHVFPLYNTQEPNPVDRLPVVYHDAHSDWLQAVAEHGLVGAALLALCAWVPLSGLRRPDLKSPIVLYPLAGCGLILLYAWVEFPFGNVAVVLAWWICFFCAVRYAQLEARIHRGGAEGRRRASPASESSAPPR